MITAIDIIPPQHIVDAFGQYQMGIAEALKGSGHPDDGRFMDLCVPWQREEAAVLRAQYVKELVRRAKHGRYNFLEFWGWPEIRFRGDDHALMIYSRVRFMHVIVVPQGRPN